ncbi:MAG: YdcF family protein [Bacteroidetes bacterium]|nr:MAG: YdcF family protein [Bacteroidota bacterium]
MPKRLRKILLWILVPGLLGAGLYLARFPILKGIGSFLIREDMPVNADAIFVLSGDADERCRAAAELFRRGLAARIVTTGSNTSSALRALQMDIPDAELGAMALQKAGIDSAAVGILPLGSSTKEEADAILGYAQAAGLKRVIIVTSRFHTRRTASVFKSLFRKNGIEAVICGAAPYDYDENRWWESEKSLIFVNNEYVKLLYYAWKY